MVNLRVGRDRPFTRRRDDESARRLWSCICAVVVTDLRVRRGRASVPP
jgi:hypothetical protein